MMPLPIEAYRVADEAASRSEAVEHAAPYIIAATLRFAAGRTQSVLTYLARHIVTLFVLASLLSVALEVESSDLRWSIAGAAFGVVFKGVVEELLLKRLLRRAVVFASRKPEYWR